MTGSYKLKVYGFLSFGFSIQDMALSFCIYEVANVFSNLFHIFL